MNILQSFLITLSMYTVIPMPATEWNGRNLRYCMAFLPAAGFVISAAEWVLFFVCYSLHLSDVFFASFFCALPVLVTGKIHIDGLIDTCDALGSHGVREKSFRYWTILTRELSESPVRSSIFFCFSVWLRNSILS